MCGKKKKKSKGKKVAEGGRIYRKEPSGSTCETLSPPLLETGLNGNSSGLPQCFGLFKKHVRWNAEVKQTLRVSRKVMDVGVRRQTRTASGQPTSVRNSTGLMFALLEAGKQVVKSSKHSEDHACRSN